jgi:uracil-DNA glycosylase
MTAPKSWESFFFKEIHKKAIRKLIHKVSTDYQKGIIYPPHNDVMKAFKLLPYDKIKAVIVGQDPYQNGQAVGLAFSVGYTASIPKSLNNIYKEYASDLGYNTPKHGDLTKWEKKGVLLLNSVLTVKKGKAFSCAYKGYQILFNDIISFLNKKTSSVVFILWGASAQKAASLISNSNHFIIKSAHPSPLSAYRGFYGSKPFSKTNVILKNAGVSPIDWKLK